MSRKSAQEEWHAKTLEYVTAVNAFVEKGLREGWENAGEEPGEPGRGPFVGAAIDAVRKANTNGELSNLRERWPPAHRPLAGLLEKKGQCIPVVCILPDGSILARVGGYDEPGRTVHLRGDSAVDVPDVPFFGHGPNRRHFAVFQKDGVHIIDGWNGPSTAKCPWPTGLEDMPDGSDASPWEAPPTPTQLIPFPSGKRVLLVCGEGAFVLSEFEAKRLLPTKEDLGWLCKENPDGKPERLLDMEHGAVSKDGKLIAVGSQDSSHLVFNDQLEIIGEVAPRSSYPHYALFSSDGHMIAFNACHFYDGVTIGVPTQILPVAELHEHDERIPDLHDNARVYAGVSRNDEFIVGDAYGYVRAFDTKGEARWQHFIGSTICAMDISPDGKTLVVATYAGFLSIIQLDAGKRAPYQIGTGNHVETRRWIFWKDEPRPLIW
ncbi:MAG: hypothetical protein MI923_01905 [Phycisphaerales bacterium]|nr:hypothetical protein [Phycisphaerales bacterium]